MNTENVQFFLGKFTQNLQRTYFRCKSLSQLVKSPFEWYRLPLKRLFNLWFDPRLGLIKIVFISFLIKQ